jgi:ATP-dependent DNA helicase DinG
LHTPGSGRQELRVERCRGQELGVDLRALEPLAAAVGPLAVVDLETTGLVEDPGAEILELGAVLIEPGAPQLAVLHSLVRPSRPIPRVVERLTGLTDADVAGAPAIAEVARPISDALAGRTLIAHNADFERRFLARFVSRELGDARYLDTLDLLALTHPDAPDLRLESFTRRLLGSEERHRALDDALDTTRVLVRVAQGASGGERRYATARLAIARFAPDSAWLALLGEAPAAEAGGDGAQFVEVGDTSESPVPFDEDAIAAALADEARGRRHLPGYRVRREQIELARQFVRNLSDGGSLLLEGGTGVGKSFAYLAAAIPFALERAEAGRVEPVVVSTRTKLLQDQLLQKDIAAAARFLGYPELRALSIKGRANYVCERRLEAVLAEARDQNLFAEDRLAYGVLLACAHTRPHGEVGTVPSALVWRYPRLRELLRRSVAVRAEQCSREQCAVRRDCPFGRRRAALAEAHLIVANHDLLLRWPPDYPSFRHVVADEGHELAGVADEVYAIEVRPEEVLERVDELFGRSGQAGGSTRALLPPDRGEADREVAVVGRHALAMDFAALGRCLADHAGEWGELELPSGAPELLPEAADQAETLAQRLCQVARVAEQRDGMRSDGDPETSNAVVKAVEALRSAAAGLRQAFCDETEDAVSAFEGIERPWDRWRLAIRAVCPAESFHERFLSRLDSFSVVSASLFVGGDAFAALGELEIEERSSLPLAKVSVESPFPYSENMRVLALEGGGDLVAEMAEVLAEVARQLGGRTLGLFTSLRRMRQVADLLAQKLRGQGFDILVPRRASDDPGALVGRFSRARGGAILLGARTFWQGLDIPGDALQAVVIEKLPFEVPTELRKRRELRLRQEGLDAFDRFTLGKMLLHLKQMTGRLIRTEDDRGIAVIVEGRTQRRYFPSLNQSLPRGVTVRVSRRAEIGDVFREIGLGDPLTHCDLES